jgi:hypothetical protein
MAWKGLVFEIQPFLCHRLVEPLSVTAAFSPWEPGLLSLARYTLMVLGLLGVLLFLCI